MKPKHKPRVAEISDKVLENDPRFLRRIENSRKSVRAGKKIRLEDIE